MAIFSGNDPEGPGAEGFAKLFGPAQIDHLIRQALQMCWMSLPEGRRTPDECEAQARRIFERAIRDFREDHQSFGAGGS